jgi:hypothetical protein
MVEAMEDIFSKCSWERPEKSGIVFKFLIIFVSFVSSGNG